MLFLCCHVSKRQSLPCRQTYCTSFVCSDIMRRTIRPQPLWQTLFFVFALCVVISIATPAWMCGTSGAYRECVTGDFDSSGCAFSASCLTNDKTVTLTCVENGEVATEGACAEITKPQEACCVGSNGTYALPVVDTCTTINCASTSGTGTAIADSQCKVNNVLADESWCTSRGNNAGTKYSTTQTAPCERPSPPGCQWFCRPSEEAEWTGCGADDGWTTCSNTTCVSTETQSRIAQCGGADNVPDSNCNGVITPLVRDCKKCGHWLCTSGNSDNTAGTLIDCTSSDAFDTCTADVATADCNSATSGTKNRKAVCVFAGAVVGDEFCIDKPEATVACQPTCVLATWSTPTSTGICTHKSGEKCNSLVGFDTYINNSTCVFNNATAHQSNCLANSNAGERHYSGDTFDCAATPNCAWQCRSPTSANWTTCGGEDGWATCADTTCSSTENRTRIAQCGGEDNVLESYCAGTITTTRECKVCGEWKCTIGNAQSTAGPFVDCDTLTALDATCVVTDIATANCTTNSGTKARTPVCLVGSSVVGDSFCMDKPALAVACQPICVAATWTLPAGSGTCTRVSGEKCDSTTGTHPAATASSCVFESAPAHESNCNANPNAGTKYGIGEAVPCVVTPSCTWQCRPSTSANWTACDIDDGWTTCIDTTCGSTETRTRIAQCGGDDNVAESKCEGTVAITSNCKSCGEWLCTLRNSQDTTGTLLPCNDSTVWAESCAVSDLATSDCTKESGTRARQPVCSKSGGVAEDAECVGIDKPVTSVACKPTCLAATWSVPSHGTCTQGTSEKCNSTVGTALATTASVCQFGTSGTVHESNCEANVNAGIKYAIDSPMPCTSAPTTCVWKCRSSANWTTCGVDDAWSTCTDTACTSTEQQTRIAQCGGDVDADASLCQGTVDLKPRDCKTCGEWKCTTGNAQETTGALVSCDVSDALDATCAVSDVATADCTTDSGTKARKAVCIKNTAVSQDAECVPSSRPSATVACKPMCDADASWYATFSPDTCTRTENEDCSATAATAPASADSVCRNKAGADIHRSNCAIRGVAAGVEYAKGEAMSCTASPVCTWQCSGDAGVTWTDCTAEGPWSPCTDTSCNAVENNKDTRLVQCDGVGNKPTSACLAARPVTERVCSVCGTWQCTVGASTKATAAVVACSDSAAHGPVCTSTYDGVGDCKKATGTTNVNPVCTTAIISITTSSVVSDDKCKTGDKPPSTGAVCTPNCLPSSWLNVPTTGACLDYRCDGSNGYMIGEQQCTRHSTGTQVDPSNCDIPAPAQANITCIAGGQTCGAWRCNTASGGGGVIGACEGTVDAVWGACSVGCNTTAVTTAPIGERTRTVKCYVSGDSETVAESEWKCGNAAKPDTTMACQGSICPSYSWEATDQPCDYDCRALESDPVSQRDVKVRCLENNFLAVKDAKCANAGDKPAPRKDCDTPICSAVAWKCATNSSATAAEYADCDTTWSPCSATCGTGIQEHHVACVQTVGSNVTFVSETACAVNADKPQVTKTCTMDSCSLYHWRVSGTPTTCPTCRENVTSIYTAVTNYTCQYSKNGSYIEADASKCQYLGPNPSVALPCTGLSMCMRKLWIYSNEWTTCSAACGAGTQQRVQKCVNSNALAQYLPDAECASITQLAELTRDCMIVACPPSEGAAAWEIGAWSNCSAPCQDSVSAAPTQNRTAVCKRASDGVQVDEVACGTKPPTSRTCNEIPCPGKWVVGEWSSCPGTCGGHTQLRTVDCKNAAGVGVDHIRCARLVTPNPQQPCGVAACPQWIVKSVDPRCSTTCGAGEQQRVVVCVDSDGRELTGAQATSTCAESVAGPQPVSTQPCNLNKPCNGWVTGEWSACSRTCGGGKKTRAVSCKVYDADGVSFKLDSTPGKVNLCAGTPPADSQICNPAQCPAGTVAYVTGDWSTCTKACDTGSQQRSVQCFSGGVLHTNLEQCASAGATPPVTRLCNTAPCSDFKWDVIATTACSSMECGPGTQINTLRCKQTLGATTPVFVPDAACAQTSLPPVSVVGCTGPVNCGTSGTCSVKGRCVCRNGFATSDFSSNIRCDVSPLITSVNIRPDVSPGEVLLATWSFANPLSSPRYLVYLVDTENQSTYIGGTIASARKFEWNVPKGIKPGLYMLKFVFNTANSALSPSFIVKNPCDNIICQNQGVCNPDTAVCACPAGFSGVLCETDLCVALNNCNAATNKGVCERSAGSARCACASGFMGARCDIATSGCTGMPVICENNGIANSCTTCTCPVGTGFSGDCCETCALSCTMTGATGTPNSDCRTCTCKPGYSGGLCECKYLEVKLAFANVSATIDADRFINNFVAEIAYHLFVSRNKIAATYKRVESNIYAVIQLNQCQQLTTTGPLSSNPFSSSVISVKAEAKMSTAGFPAPGAAPIFLIGGQNGYSPKALATAGKNTARLTASHFINRVVSGAAGHMLLDSHDDTLKGLADKLVLLIRDTDSDLFRGESAAFINSAAGIGITQPSCTGAGCPSSIGGEEPVDPPPDDTPPVKPARRGNDADDDWKIPLTVVLSVVGGLAIVFFIVYKICFRKKSVRQTNTWNGAYGTPTDVEMVA